MRKPRKDRGTNATQVVSIVAVLMLLFANGQALVVTLQPACG